VWPIRAAAAMARAVRRACGPAALRRRNAPSAGPFAGERQPGILGPRLDSARAARLRVGCARARARARVRVRTCARV